MIQAVTTPAHKQAFATAIQGAPYFRAVMGRDLALWADNPGAPVRLFTLPGAAMTLNGSTAQLCGTPMVWEELLSDLQFAGIDHRIAEESQLLPAATGEPLFLYSMPPQGRLPLAQEPQGYMLNRSPSVLRLATQLFPQEPERQDCYYSETCTALAHGPLALRFIGSPLVSGGHTTFCRLYRNGRTAIIPKPVPRWPTALPVCWLCRMQQAAR